LFFKYIYKKRFENWTAKETAAMKQSIHKTCNRTVFPQDNWMRKSKSAHFLIKTWLMF